MVLALALALSLTGAAFAAGVPKAACFLMVNYGDVLHLNLKNMGTAKSSSGNVKMYAVSGNQQYIDPTLGPFYSFPVTGTAYISPGTTWVHAVLTGGYTYQDDTDPNNPLVGMASIIEEVWWDLTATGTPEVYLRWSDDTATYATERYDLNLIDCATDPIPFAAKNLKSPRQKLFKR
jgi:hypothetical protein